MRLTEFGRSGQYTGSDDLMARAAAEGFMARQRQFTAVQEARINDAARLFGDCVQGRQDFHLIREMLAPKHEYILEEVGRLYPALRLSETMSVTDFSQYLTVDVLDRALWGYYDTMPVPNMALVKKETLRDFRTVKRLEVDGGVSAFTKRMNPAEPPPQRTLAPVAPITYSPDVFDGYMSVNWRAIVNDDLGIFNDLIQRLTYSWNLTVWKAITELYVDANGPHASLYNATFKNQIIVANGASVANPPLDFQGLIDARTVLGRMLSPDGNPIVFPGKLYLWYGSDLATTAAALLSALRADISVGGGTTNGDGFPSQRLSVGPAYITGGLVPIEDKMIPQVCTDATIKRTMWGLTYEPSAQARPSLVFGQLRGWENPVLLQRAPNTMRAGGGIDPTLGDFWTGDIDYKSMAIFGGTQGDGRSTVASTGKGS